jgi:cytochrome c biogenesis factor
LIIELFLSALFVFLLGTAYVKGFDYVKRRSPDHLVHFYLIMAMVRMLLVGTVVALYVLFAPSREDAIRFAAILFVMYVTMMAVTLSLRH